MSTPLEVQKNPDGSWTAKGGSSLTVLSLTAVTEHKAVAGHAVALSAIQAQGKGWIKCSDRLPLSGYVLTFRPSAPHDNKVATLQYDSHQERFGGQYLVTHWQPLPSPPTE